MSVKSPEVFVRLEDQDAWGVQLEGKAGSDTDRNIPHAAMGEEHRRNSAPEMEEWQRPETRSAPHAAGHLAPAPHSGAQSHARWGLTAARLGPRLALVSDFVWH